MNNTPWSEQEEMLLLAHPDTAPSTLSVMLGTGRTPDAIRAKRNSLQREHEAETLERLLAEGVDLTSYGPLSTFCRDVEPAAMIPTSIMPLQRNTIELKGVSSFACFGDTHFPLQHGPFMTSVALLARKWGIKDAIINGDVFNFDAFKSFPAGEDDAPLETELAAATSSVEALLKTFDRIYIDTGNHDGRLLQRLLNSSLNVRRFLKLFTDSDAVRMTKFSWIKVINDDARWIAGHPDRYSKIPGKKAHDIAREKYPDFHVISAHDHNVGMMLRRNSLGTFWAIGPGACFDPFRSEYSETSFNDIPNMNVGAVLVKDNHPYLLTLDSDFEAYGRMYAPEPALRVVSAA